MPGSSSSPTARSTSMLPEPERSSTPLNASTVASIGSSADALIEANG